MDRETTRRVQARLVELSYLRADGVDGDYGPRTNAAVSAYQVDHQMVATGECDDATLESLGVERAPADGIEPLKVLPSSEVERIFGRYRWTSGVGQLIDPDPDWVAANIQRFSFPELRGIQGVEGRGSVFDGYMRLHRLAGPIFQSFVEAAFKAGLGDHFLSWDGAAAFRRMRGSNRLSRHAWGIAIDFNADWNPFGEAPAAPGEKGSLWELAPLMRQHGIASGLYWTRPDGMHMEIAVVG